MAGDFLVLDAFGIPPDEDSELLLTGPTEKALDLDKLERLIWILALYLDFEGEKNIHVLKVLIWGFGGHWRLLIVVWDLDLDLDMVTGLWYTHVLIFGSLSYLEGAKNIHVLYFGVWRKLQIPDWGLAS